MDIIGFPNYLIYEDGRVWSKKSKRFLKHLVANGYYYVSLRNDGKTYNRYIHRLIATHFINNLRNHRVVDHINRNRKDNTLSNLRWVSDKTNQQNTGKQFNNTSGHKGISRNNNGWTYRKYNNGITHQRWFLSKTDALCYKYIYLLKNK